MEFPGTVIQRPLPASPLPMSLSHCFSLLAKRLSPRQISFQLLLAFSADGPVHPSFLLYGFGAALIPGLFYGLAAVLTIGDLIVLTMWVLR